jgi:hypothetical protein
VRKLEDFSVGHAFPSSRSVGGWQGYDQTTAPASRVKRARILLGLPLFRGFVRLSISKRRQSPLHPCSVDSMMCGPVTTKWQLGSSALAYGLPFRGWLMMHKRMDQIHAVFIGTHSIRAHNQAGKSVRSLSNGSHTPLGLEAQAALMAPEKGTAG